MVSEFGGNRKTPGSIFRKDVLRFALRDYSKQNRNRWVVSSVPSAMRILQIISLSLSLSHTHTHTHIPPLPPHTQSSLSMTATLLKAGNCLGRGKQEP